MPAAFPRFLSWTFLLAVLICTASGAELSALQISGRGRELVDVQGRSVFLLGDTAWSLVLRMSRADAAHYLEQRKKQGFNAVAFVLFAPGRTELTASHANYYGDLPFEGGATRQDPTKPLTTPGHAPADAKAYDYWDHVDHVVGLARALGLYVIMLPTWGSGLSGSHDGKSVGDIVFNTRNAEAYARWLAERYGRERHVLWMLGGDRSAVYGERDYRPVVRAMAAGLREAETRQLISYHPRKAAPQSAEWFHADDWLAFNSVQDWPEAQMEHMVADWARTPPKPTWLFEGRYEAYWRGGFKESDWGAWQVRQQAYQTIFSGAFGHMYGHERVFGFAHDGANWKEYLDAPGAQSMTHLAKLIGRLTPTEWGSRTPAPDLLEGAMGKAERLRSDRVLALRFDETGRVWVYSASGRTTRLRLDRLPPGSYQAFWYNPRLGTWHRNGIESEEPAAFATDVAAGASATARDFSAPTGGDGEDWILELRRVDAFGRR